MTDADDRPTPPPPPVPAPVVPSGQQPPSAAPLAPPTGPPVATWPVQPSVAAPPVPMTAHPPTRGSRSLRAGALIAAAITITALVLATISYTRGNSWKHRAETAARQQRELNDQLDQSEADVKGLEGRLAAVANLNAKNTDERAFAQSVVNGVARLSTAADALKGNTGACDAAVKHLQAVTGTDPAAPLDPVQLRSATDAVSKSCAGIDAQVADLQSAIAGIGQ